MFIFTIEKLGQAIKEAVSNENGKPIFLGRGGPALSHLFFADDFVLFKEASLENVSAIKAILDQFCAYSRHKVNSNKYKMYFLVNTEAATRNAICSVFKFQQQRIWAHICGFFYSITE